MKRIVLLIADDHEAEMALAALVGKRELTVRELKGLRKKAQRCKVNYAFSAPE